MDPILLSVPDACRALGIGRSKLYELVSLGEISARKLGKKTLIPRKDILSLAARLPAGLTKKTAA